ncbi:MAG: hypothetical protein ACREHC_07695 [Candidatus Levyibacteriota bacterium]
MMRDKLLFPLAGILVALLLYVFGSMYLTNQHQGGGGSADNSANASGGIARHCISTIEEWHHRDFKPKYHAIATRILPSKYSN